MSSKCAKVNFTEHLQCGHNVGGGHGNSPAAPDAFSVGRANLASCKQKRPAQFTFTVPHNNPVCALQTKTWRGSSFNSADYTASNIHGRGLTSAPGAGQATQI